MEMGMGWEPKAEKELEGTLLMMAEVKELVNTGDWAGIAKDLYILPLTLL